jgi:hypothetical protein
MANPFEFDRVILNSVQIGTCSEGLCMNCWLRLTADMYVLGLCILNWVISNYKFNSDPLNSLFALSHR